MKFGLWIAAAILLIVAGMAQAEHGDAVVDDMLANGCSMVVEADEAVEAGLDPLDGLHETACVVTRAEWNWMFGHDETGDEPEDEPAAILPKRLAAFATQSADEIPAHLHLELANWMLAAQGEIAVPTGGAINSPLLEETLSFDDSINALPTAPIISQPTIITLIGTNVGDFMPSSTMQSVADLGGDAVNIAVADETDHDTSSSGKDFGPNAKDGTLYVYTIRGASGNSNRAAGVSHSDVSLGANRLESQIKTTGYSVNVIIKTVSSNCWSHGSSKSVFTQRADLRADLFRSTAPAACKALVDAKNEVVLGWIRKGYNNGVAYLDGTDGSNYAPVAIASEKCVTDAWYTGCPDWKHRAIAAHEIAHLFSGAHDAKKDNAYALCWYDNWYGGDYYMCRSIMHYPWAYAEGSSTSNIIWDGDNKEIIGNNLCACTKFGSDHRWSDHP